MTSRAFCIVALALWVIGIAGLGWLFIAGWTAPGSDGRTEVRLGPSERDQILAEMRQLLKSVHGVVAGMSQQDLRQAEQAARTAGVGMAADVDPAIMAKLPLPFKQMGMSVHRDFDHLADAIAKGEAPERVLQQLSSITSRCTTCHDIYRLSAADRR
jgi:cytochrome c556